MPPRISNHLTSSSNALASFLPHLPLLPIYHLSHSVTNSFFQNSLSLSFLPLLASLLPHRSPYFHFHAPHCLFLTVAPLSLITTRPPVRSPPSLPPSPTSTRSPDPLLSSTFETPVAHLAPPRPRRRPRPGRMPRPSEGHGVDGRAAAVAAPSVTWSRDALQHGGAVGPRRRFLTGRCRRTRPVPAGTPGPQLRLPARSRRPPAGLPAPAGPGPCRRARPRACSCPGPWRRS